MGAQREGQVGGKEGQRGLACEWEGRTGVGPGQGEAGVHRVCKRESGEG